MTVEIKTLIELSDLDSVRFECLACGATQSRKLTGNNQRWPSRCANCLEAWFGGERDGTLLALQNILDSIGNITEAVAQKKAAGMKLTVRVEVPGVYRLK